MTTPSQPPELTPWQERKLEAVMNAACTVFTPRYRPDSCVAAARVLVDVFDRLHARARPPSVVVDVFSPSMVARAEAEGGRLPADTEEYQRWIEESGCWWLTLGGGGDPEPGKWPGHVGVVAWESVLIDLTLPQAARPQRGIALAPAAIQVGAEFLDGSEGRVVTMNGSELHYQARPENRSFMQSPDWRDRKRHRDVVQAILRRARDELANDCS
jgi:hypothetical protein